MAAHAPASPLSLPQIAKRRRWLGVRGRAGVVVSVLLVGFAVGSAAAADTAERGYAAERRGGLFAGVVDEIGDEFVGRDVSTAPTIAASLDRLLERLTEDGAGTHTMQAHGAHLPPGHSTRGALGGIADAIGSFFGGGLSFTLSLSLSLSLTRALSQNGKQSHFFTHTHTHTHTHVFDTQLQARHLAVWHHR
jgi:hypothetical protein